MKDGNARGEKPLTLFGLLELCKFYAECAKHPNDIKVLVECEDHSAGRRAGVYVLTAYKRFDWECNSFIITPACPLHLRAARPKVQKKENDYGTGRKTYSCHECAAVARKKDRFCKECGVEFDA